MEIGPIRNSPLALAANVAKVGYRSPRDRNQDGLVSTAELNAHSLRHPELEIQKALRTPRRNRPASKPNTAPAPLYNRKAAFDPWEKASSSRFDLYG